MAVKNSTVCLIMVVFGNQQNGGRLGAAKKSGGFPVFLSQQNDVPSLFPQSDNTDKTGYGFPQSGNTDASGYVFPQPDNADKTGYVFAEQEQPVPVQQEAEEAEKAEGGQPMPVEGRQRQAEGAWQQAEDKELPLVPVMEEGAGSVSEGAGLSLIHI